MLTPEGTPAQAVLAKLLGVYADKKILAVPGDVAEEDLPDYWPKPVRADQILGVLEQAGRATSTG